MLLDPIVNIRPEISPTPPNLGGWDLLAPRQLICGSLGDRKIDGDPPTVMMSVLAALDDMVLAELVVKNIRIVHNFHLAIEMLKYCYRF